MTKAKIDLIHSSEWKEKAEEALKPMKELEAKFKEQMITVVTSNGMIVSCNNQELLNETIKYYGEL